MSRKNTKNIIPIFTAKDWRKEQQESEQDRGFSGMWIKLEILELFEEGKISAIEVLLIGQINRFVESKRVGCWASNKRLAQHLGGLTQRYVSELISRLQNKGLVRSIESDRYPRLLETFWCRARKKKKRKEKNVG